MPPYHDGMLARCHASPPACYPDDSRQREQRLPEQTPQYDMLATFHGQEYLAYGSEETGGRVQPMDRVARYESKTDESLAEWLAVMPSRRPIRFS